jgi:peptidoglycan L-alanyl-D-glutamate endopeptidase CwlK
VSAGFEISYHLARPTSDPQLLAPGFRVVVAEAIRECTAKGLRAVVFETYRSNELQALYYQRGRTVKPPPTPVTNAMGNLFSWHGYGLAVDVIHETQRWRAGNDWFAKVAEVFRKHGCRWGGEWRSPDWPHFQWGLCKPSPSDLARELIRTRGVGAVWEAVGALGIRSPVPQSVAVTAAPTPAAEAGELVTR